FLPDWPDAHGHFAPLWCDRQGLRPGEFHGSTSVAGNRGDSGRRRSTAVAGDPQFSAKRRIILF
ncbi:MAG: hypothetical protein ACREJ0_07840, partial [Geminicoccaceae bacterium]